MTNIYLATPLDGDKRKEAEKALRILEHKGFTVYAPWLFHVEHEWDYPNHEWGLMVFQADTQAISDAEFVVVLSYGRNTTAGTAWEAGFAYARDKFIILVEMNDEKQSLMMANGRYATVKGLRGLANYDFEDWPKSRTLTEQK